MSLTTIMKRTIPRSLQPAVKRAWHLTRDYTEEALSLRDPLKPPARLHFVGQGDFEEIGSHLLGLLVEHGALKPSARVLDVGSGNGRVAVRLTQYLDEKGSYEGVDIVDAGIEWCQRKITPRHPRFRFQKIDVFNPRYNPGGRVEAKNFSFPFTDGEFDLVFLTSVFTHMLPQDVNRYLSEIQRVLKPGGRCFATFFLLNAESRRQLEAKATMIEFPHARDGYSLMDDRVPEAAVAFPEEDVRAMVANSGLKLQGNVLYGTWCGRKPGTSYQDIVIADKAAYH